MNAALAIRLTAVAASLVALTSCGSPASDRQSSDDDRPTFAATPERSAEGKSIYHYNTLPEQAEASSFIVRGRVVSVEPGRGAGELPEEKIYFRNVTIEVLETAKGAVDPKTLSFEEEGWDADGSGYVVNGAKWSAVGDEAWYFLAERDDGITRLTSAYGRYALTGSDKGPSGSEPEVEGPWRKYLGKSVTHEQIRTAVLSAAKGQS